jgi:hypothetical protein
VRLLWLLLYTTTTNYILHSRLSLSSRLCLRDASPSFPSPIPRSDVFWAWPLVHHPHRSWLVEVWLEDANVEDESRLDGIDDGIQPYRQRVVCYESELKSLMTTLFLSIREQG